MFSPAPVPYPVAGGPVTSPAVHADAAGTYRWIAAYSGDANNAPVTGACNDANESATVDAGAPDDRDDGIGGVALGAGTLTDTAIVSGRVNPQAGATITFTLYGPGDATCAGAPAFTPHPALPGRRRPGRPRPPFTPTAPGTYRWIAAYSGDANNAPVSRRVQRRQRVDDRRQAHSRRSRPTARPASRSAAAR